MHFHGYRLRLVWKSRDDNFFNMDERVHYFNHYENKLTHWIISSEEFPNISFTNLTNTYLHFHIPKKKITTGATCGAGCACPSGAPEITPVFFYWVRVSIVPLFVTFLPIVSVCFVHTSLSI